MSAIKMELLELQCMEEKYSTLLGLVTESTSRTSTGLPQAVSDFSDFAFQVGYYWRYVALVVVLWRPALSASVTALR